MKEAEVFSPLRLIALIVVLLTTILLSFTGKGFDPDPLTGIIGAMKNLNDGKVGIFQALSKAVKNPWAESILRSVTDFEGNAFFADSPEMTHFAREKVRSPLFGAIIRVAGQSPHPEHA